MLLQQLLHETPRLLAEPAFQRPLLLHHDRRPLAHHAQRRRDLAADVRAADQHHVLGVPHALPDRVRVPQRPQIVDLLQLAPLHVQPAHVRPRRDQRLAELDLLLARQLRRARLQVEPRHARPRQQLDLLLPPPLRRPEQRLLAALFPAQIPLRALRPVIRRVRLAADEQDLALRAFLAQRQRAVRARQAAADQQVVDLSVGHPAIYAKAGTRRVSEDVPFATSPTGRESSNCIGRRLAIVIENPRLAQRLRQARRAYSRKQTDLDSWAPQPRTSHPLRAPQARISQSVAVSSA